MAQWNKEERAALVATQKKYLEIARGDLPRDPDIYTCPLCKAFFFDDNEDCPTCPAYKYYGPRDEDFSCYGGNLAIYDQQLADMSHVTDIDYVRATALGVAQEIRWILKVGPRDGR